MGTQMNVGLLVMEDGDTYTYEGANREVAILLFEGKVTYEYAGKTVEADRPNCFHHEAYACWLPRAPKSPCSQPQRALHAGHPEREGIMSRSCTPRRRSDPARRFQGRADGCYGA